jgi:hypothetical protein
MGESMTYPTGQQYREALFGTEFSFKDPDLRGGEPRTDLFGMPKPIGGNFASVYTVQGKDGRHWAVKCFTRYAPDRDERYRKISAALRWISSAWKVGFEYLAEGVLCRGTWYPVIKMEWVEATSLLSFVEAHHTDKKELTLLAAKFRGLMLNLAHHGIAHGDLQHGNILVLPSGELKLIDYDGMYVPGLDAVGGSELGHPNYQSPHRSSKDWGPDMDRFSAWVIYTSLSALALDPSLWHALHAEGDEALLFHKDDFANRLSSRARQALAKSSDPVVCGLATKVDFLWSPDLAAIPPLGMDRPPKKPASVNLAPAAVLPDWLRHNLAVEGAANVGGHWRQAVAEAEQEIIRLESTLDEIIRKLDSEKYRIQNAADETRAILKQQYEAAQQQQVDEIMVIDSQLNAIMKEKQDELAKALGILQQAYISQRLSKTKIPKYAIPSIGPETVSSLAEIGILTAADFTKVSYMNDHGTITLWDGREVQLGGIGPRRAEALTGWRLEMESRARANQPTVLPKREYDAIVGKRARSLAHEKKASSVRAEAKKEALRTSWKELDYNIEKEINDIKSYFSRLRAEEEAELDTAHQKLESAKRELMSHSAN